jgi:hypothetical protein
MVRLSRRDFGKLSAIALGTASCGYPLIPRVARADIVAHKWFSPPPSDFTTSSGPWVQSNMPLVDSAHNGMFTKRFNSTALWVICIVDMIPTAAHSNFTGVWVNNQNRASVAISGPPNEDITVNITDFILDGFAAGPYTFNIMVGTNGGPTTWQFKNACDFRVTELQLPPYDPENG